MVNGYSRGATQGGDHEALAVDDNNLCQLRRRGKQRKGPKLSVVRDAEHGRSSRELRLRQFRAMHGLCPGDWWVLHAK